VWGEVCDFFGFGDGWLDLSVGLGLGCCFGVGWLLYFGVVAFDFEVFDDVGVDVGVLASALVDGGGFCLRGWGLDEVGRAGVLFGVGGLLGVTPGFEGVEGGWKWGTFTDYVGILAGRGDVGVDELVLMWHLENQGWRFPQLVGGWWMEGFVGRGGAGLFAPHGGSTGFVDMCDVLGLVSGSLRSWLDEVWVLELDYQCPFKGARAVGFEVVGVWEGGEKVLVSFEGGFEFLAFSRPLVESHFCSDRRVLRLPVASDSWLGDGGLLWRVGGRVPCSRDVLWLGLVRDVVRGACFGGGVSQLWWDWCVDDFLVVDLHRGLHAVNGGFVPEGRRMWSMWCHEVHPELGSEPRWENCDVLAGRGVFLRPPGGYLGG